MKESIFITLLVIAMAILVGLIFTGSLLGVALLKAKGLW